MTEVCGDHLPTAPWRIGRRRAIGILSGAVLAVVTRPELVHAAPIEVAPGLAIRPRDDWADGRAPTGVLAPEPDVRFLLVHHTASANGADPVSIMRTAYNFHTGPEKGWPDVAYNFFIDQFGEVWEGRAGSLAGPVEASATGGSQGFAQLVCLLGDFTGELPTPAALASLNATLAWLADRYAIDTKPGTTTQFVSRGSNRWPAGENVVAQTISGHRDMSKTACPGDTFYPHLVATVAGEVTALRAGPSPTTSTLLPTTLATTTTVASTTAVPPTTATPPTSEPSDPTESTAPITTADAAPAVEPPTVTPSAGPTKPGPTTSASSQSNTALVPALAATGALAAIGGVFVARRRAATATEDQVDNIEPNHGGPEE